MRYDYKQLENTYEASQQSLQNQIDGLQEIHAEELERKEQALRTYRDALELLERQYEKERGQIEVWLKKELLKLKQRSTTADNSQKTKKNSQNK
jgi:hypothetical protein